MSGELDAAIALMEDTGVERYSLDDTAIALIAELRSTANIGIQTVLTYFARQNKLCGQVKLAENGREIIIVRQ